MRIFLKIVLLVVVGVFWAWAFVVEPFCLLSVKEVPMVSSKWDKSLGEIKIALVSDIHAGAFPWEKWRVERIITKTNEAGADIIFLLGDYLNGQIGATKMDPDVLAGMLSKLKAPLGVYAIYGNHDAYADPTHIGHILRKSGVKILDDTNVVISTPKGKFCVAGILDPHTMPYSYTRTFDGVLKDVPCILLTHSPKVYYEIPNEAKIAFAGHTHGGQVRLPFFGAVSSNCGLSREFAEGRIEGEVDMYVTRGVGTSRIPVRFLCPPEITIIKLSGTLERE